jgi:RNA polymerase sigma factor (sigma-70 family)
MFSKVISHELLWDFTASESVEKSQSWVLTTMQRYGPELITMLWRILGNEQDACDAYQSTFLQLAHHQAGHKPNHIKAYVFRTANNVAITILRHKLAEENRISKSQYSKNNYYSPVNELDCKYLVETLRCCITKLPEHLRNVITLHDLAELPYHQVGRILGISSATARVYRCRAIQLLSVWMNKNENLTRI